MIITMMITRRGRVQSRVTMIVIVVLVMISMMIIISDDHQKSRMQSRVTRFEAAAPLSSLDATSSPTNIFGLNISWE